MTARGDTVTITMPTASLWGQNTAQATVAWVRPNGTIDCLVLDPGEVHDLFMTGVRPKEAWDLLPDGPDKNLAYFA